MTDIRSAAPATDPAPIPTPTALACPHDAVVFVIDEVELLDGHEIVVEFEEEFTTVKMLLRMFPNRVFVTGTRTLA